MIVYREYKDEINSYRIYINSFISDINRTNKELYISSNRRTEGNWIICDDNSDGYILLLYKAIKNLKKFDEMPISFFMIIRR